MRSKPLEPFHRNRSLEGRPRALVDQPRKTRWPATRSLNYWSRRIAREQARSLGFDETLGSTEGRGYVEAASANLFAVLDDELVTPTLEAPILPGITRGIVIQLARHSGMVVREVAGIAHSDLIQARELFLTNSVRGIIPVAFAEDRRSGFARGWPAPGPKTRILLDCLAD